MTAQIGERIIYNDKEYSMCTEPLEIFFRLSVKNIKFDEPASDLWRGYIGSWEIKENRLYLTDIKGTLINGNNVSLDVLFPGYSKRVFAHWFSGILRLPDGKLLNYIHLGYASEYERDILITIDKGIVKNTYIKQKGISEEKDAPDGYGVAAYTVFSDNQGSDK